MVKFHLFDSEEVHVQISSGFHLTILKQFVCLFDLTMATFYFPDLNAPDNIQITPLYKESAAEISWDSTHDCPNTKYEVTIYTEGGDDPMTVRSDGPPIRINDLQQCIPLSLTVRKCEKWWEGDESEKKAFQILDGEGNNN